jgi:DtxR family transcriptional regulator, iron-dependent repressor
MKQSGAVRVCCTRSVPGRTRIIRTFSPKSGEKPSIISALMITVSQEDYLKAIAEAEAEDKTVISATLAHWLSVTRPAVTAALRRLAKDGLVRVGKDGRVQLTAAGRAIAERTIFRHYLIERMLTEIFGMSWYEVHEEAERLEHAVSPAFEEKLAARLGRNHVCPHGNSLTLGRDFERRKHGFCLLNEAEQGKKYQVKSVYERDRKLLELLDREGLLPGTVILVDSLNYDGTITLAIGKSHVRLGLPAAAKVWVAKA